MLALFCWSSNARAYASGKWRAWKGSSSVFQYRVTIKFVHFSCNLSTISWSMCLWSFIKVSIETLWYENSRCEAFERLIVLVLCLEKSIIDLKLTMVKIIFSACVTKHYSVWFYLMHVKNASRVCVYCVHRDYISTASVIRMRFPGWAPAGQGISRRACSKWLPFSDEFVRLQWPLMPSWVTFNGIQVINGRWVSSQPFAFRVWTACTLRVGHGAWPRIWVALLICLPYFPLGPLGLTTGRPRLSNLGLILWERRPVAPQPPFPTCWLLSPKAEWILFGSI